MGYKNGVQCAFGMALLKSRKHGEVIAFLEDKTASGGKGRNPELDQKIADHLLKKYGTELADRIGFDSIVRKLADRITLRGNPDVAIEKLTEAVVGEKIFNLRIETEMQGPISTRTRNTIKNPSNTGRNRKRF